MGLYVIRSLKRNRILSVIIIIQLALTFVLLNKSLSVNASYTVSRSQIEKIYGQTNLCRMKDKSDEATLIHSTATEENVVERQAELYGWLKSSSDFTFMSYQEYEINFYDRIPDGDSFLHSYDASNGAWMKAFRADEDFLEEYPVDVAEGRGFQHADFMEESALPVILGSNYRAYYSVGDRIDVPSNPFQRATTLHVIGIAKANTYVAYPNRPEGAILVDDYILYPYLTPNEQTSFAEYDMLIFQSVILPKNFEAARTTIKEVARRLQLYEIELTNPVSKSQRYAKMVNSNSSFVWIASVAVIGFTLITISSALRYRFHLHKRDYGRFMLCGGTRTRMALEFTAEVVVLLLISNLITMIVCSADGNLNVTRLLACDAFLVCAIYALTFLALHKLDIAKLMQEENVRGRWTLRRETM